MKIEENPIEEEKSASRTQRFAEWLMKRDERRQEKETSLEGLMKFNIFLSIGTLIAVAGSTVTEYAILAYMWV